MVGRVHLMLLLEKENNIQLTLIVEQKFVGTISAISLGQTSKNFKMYYPIGLMAFSLGLMAQAQRGWLDFEVPPSPYMH